MSSRHTHLEVEERSLGSGVRRETRLCADSGDSLISVHHDIFGGRPGSVRVLDGFVQGVLLHCMRLGLPLRVHGPLSSSAAYNLDDLQRAWALWKPHRYRHIDIIPDSIVRLAPRCGKTVQAFSGGVDATFALANNNFIRKDKGGYDISGAVFVQGLDIAYDNDADFSRLCDEYGDSLNRSGVHLHSLRTNSKALHFQDWEDSFGMQVAACLHQFDSDYDRALIGSSEPYDRLVIPWGSTPITDHLCSGDLMAIVHDGAGFSRTEKIAVIARLSLADNLRVCWQGTSGRGNCGFCEKCIRTRLNFAAVGIDNPPCFSSPFDPSLIRKLTPRGDAQAAELASILSFIDKHDLDRPWTAALARKIRAYRLHKALARVAEGSGLPWLARKINRRLNRRRRARPSPSAPSQQEQMASRQDVGNG